MFQIFQHVMKIKENTKKRITCNSIKFCTILDICAFLLPATMLYEDEIDRFDSEYDEYTDSIPSHHSTSKRSYSFKVRKDFSETWIWNADEKYELLCHLCTL